MKHSASAQQLKILGVCPLPRDVKVPCEKELQQVRLSPAAIIYIVSPVECSQEPPAQLLLFTAQNLKLKLKESVGIELEIGCLATAQQEQPSFEREITQIMLQLDLECFSDSDEGYSITVDAAKGVLHLRAQSPRGIFYATQTLFQLILACNFDRCGTKRGEAAAVPLTLPIVEIADKPDFRARGVMLDISRDKG